MRIWWKPWAKSSLENQPTLPKSSNNLSMVWIRNLSLTIMVFNPRKSSQKCHILYQKNHIREGPLTWLNQPLAKKILHLTLNFLFLERWILIGENIHRSWIREQVNGMVRRARGRNRGGRLKKGRIFSEEDLEWWWWISGGRQHRVGVCRGHLKMKISNDLIGWDQTMNLDVVELSWAWWGTTL